MNAAKNLAGAAGARDGVDEMNLDRNFERGEIPPAKTANLLGVGTIATGVEDAEAIVRERFSDRIPATDGIVEVQADQSQFDDAQRLNEGTPKPLGKILSHIFFFLKDRATTEIHPLPLHDPFPT